MCQQFPACVGHIPLKEFCEKQEQLERELGEALAEIKRLQPRTDEQVVKDSCAFQDFGS